MSRRGEIECLGDIQEAIIRIEQYTGKVTYQAFLADVKTQDAVVRNLEVIGEAVKNLSAEFKRTHRQIEWSKIAGLRDKIIHHYFGVNWDIVWDVIQHKLPELKGAIEILLRQAKKS